MRSAVRTPGLWLPLAGPIIGSLHFTISYIAIATGCSERYGVAGGAGLAVVLSAIVSVLAVGICSVAVWRRYAALERGDSAGATSIDRSHFMARMTLMLAAFSLAGIVYVSVPLLLVGGCS